LLLLLPLLLLQPQSDIQALALQPPVPIEALALQQEFVIYTTSCQNCFSNCDSCGEEIKANDDEVKRQRVCSAGSVQRTGDILRQPPVSGCSPNTAEWVHAQSFRFLS
jgi:hypothetical protein